MRKITFLFALIALLAFNVFGQTEVVTSNPTWDGANQIDLCLGGSFTISITNTDATHTYNLTQADSRALLHSLPGNGGTITFPAVSPASGSTSYSVFDATDYSPFVNFTASVVAQPLAPTMTKSPNQAAVCAGTDVSATVNVAGSGGVSGCVDSYEYSTDGGTTWSAYTTGTAISTTGLSGTDIVQIMATRSDPDGRGCDASNLYTWTVNALANPSIAGETSPCLNSAEIYTTDGSMTNYNWSVTNGTISSGAGTDQITVDWNTATGAGNVSVYYDDGNSCTSNTTTLNVDVKALPIPALSGTAVVCAHTEYTYTTDAGQSNYVWSVSGGTITAGGTATDAYADITWGATGSGTVSVNYADNVNGCSATNPTQLNVTNDGPVHNTNQGLYYCKIQDAIDNANINDVIEVADGNYPETINITVAGLHLKSVNGAAVTTITGGGGAGELAATVRFSADNIFLEGFTIDNSTFTCSGTGRAVGPKSSNGATIKDNIFKNAYRGVAGDWYGSPTNLTITGNTFDGNFGVCYGIVGTENIDGLTITNNTFVNLPKKGVSLGVGVANLTLTGNSFSNITERHIGNYDPVLPFNVVTVMAANTFDLAAGVDEVAGSLIQGIYPTISLAVDNAEAGTTVHVLAGTYVESVTINKSLELRGAQYNIDPRGNAWTTSISTIDANGGIYGVYITAANVTVNGFKVINAAGSTVNLYGGIGVVGTSQLTGIDISYNWLDNNSANGIFVSNVTAPVVEYNYCSNNGDVTDNVAGISLYSSATQTITNGSVSNNECFGNQSYGIYIASAANVASSIAGTVVNNNEIHSNTKYGLQLLSHNFQDAVTNLVVSGNVIYSNQRNGLKIVSVSSCDINTNDIYSNGAGGTSDKYKYGIMMESYTGKTATDNSFTNNSIHGNTLGSVILQNTGGSYTGNVFNSNSFVETGTNLCINNLSTDNIDATCNWWGTEDAYAVEAETSGDVQFLPYLIVNNTSGTSYWWDTSNNYACDGVGPVLVYDNDPSTTGTLVSSHMTIQGAIDAPTTLTGYYIEVAAGTYEENLTVDKSLTITGQSQTGTLIYPALSAPMPGSSGSLPAGASNIILIQADDVSIRNMTIDGDNPNLTSGTIVNGADIDARNGIIQDYTAGSYTGLDVNHITMQNIYLRGIYASTGGYFDISNNTVSNVAGEAQSIPIMNWSGSGVFSNNSVSNSNDGIVSNHSKGVTYEYNTVTNCGSGIHTDNNGDGGGTADTIRYNTVSNGTAGSYGIFVFASRLDNAVYENTVSGVSVGLCASGQIGGTPLFSRNTVNNAETGVYTTTSLFGWGSSDCSASFTNNFINNSTTEAFNCDADTLYTNTTTANSNHISGSATNANVSGTGSLNIDLTCNWWGSTDAGTIAAGMNGNIQFLPFLTDGTDDEPSTPGFQPVPGSCDGLGPVVNITQGTSFMTIQAAIDDAVANDVIEVAAGTYEETLYIYKSLELRGPNYGISGTSASRVNEAIIRFVGGTTGWDAIIYCDADNVLIDGFTISDEGGVAGEDLTGIISVEATNIQVSNNIVDGFTYISIWIHGEPYPALTPRVTTVTNNYCINNHGLYHTIYIQGIGGSVSGNTVESCAAAIQVQPYGQPNVGTVQNNSFEGYVNGIYHNYASLGSGKWTYTNNSVSAVLPPAGGKRPSTIGVGEIANNTGFTLPEDIDAASDNSTRGAGNDWIGIHVRTHGTSGSGAAPEVEFNTGNNVDGAIALTDPYWADVIGLQFRNTGNSALTKFYNNDITNVDYGIKVFDDTNNGSLVDLDNNTFSNYSYAILVEPDMDIDASSGNTYEGVASGTASLAELFTIEDAIIHKIDEGSRGFVTVITNNDYVTVNSFAGVETTPSIQRGINAASTGWTVNVNDGTYANDFTVDKALSILGPNNGIDPNTGTRVPEATINAKITINSPDVGILGFNIDDLKAFAFYNGNLDNLNLSWNFITGMDAGIQINYFEFSGTRYNSNNVTISHNYIGNMTGTVDASPFYIGGLVSSQITYNKFSNTLWGAIQLAGCSDFDFNYNDFEDITAKKGYWVQFTSDNDNVRVLNNTGTNTTGGVKLYGNDPSDYHTNFEIAFNTFNTLVAPLSGDASQQEPHIAVWDFFGAYADGLNIHDNTLYQVLDNLLPNAAASSAMAFYGVLDNVSVINNTLTLSGTFPGPSYFYGMYIRGGAKNYTIQNNTFTGSASAAGTMGIKLAIKEHPAYTGFASDGTTVLIPWNPTDANIQINSGNTFEDFEYGFRFFKNYPQEEGLIAGATVNINGNNILNNTYGLSNVGGEETVGATPNWWGDASGPYNDPYNTCGLGNEVIGDVDFMPWYTDAAMTTTSGVLPVQNTDQATYYCSIQDAIDDAVSGEHIVVAAGTFVEQLHITTDNLFITGAGAGSTVVESPDNLTLFFTTSANNYPIVFVDGVASATISDLTIDGAGKGNANNRFVGIGFYNAGGTLQNAKILNIMDASFSGSQHGNGLYAIEDDGGSYQVTVTNVEVLDYQKGGLTFNSAGITANITNCTVVGQGATNITAQNGIQFWGAGGTIDNCNVSDNIYTGTGWLSTGILIYRAANVDVTNTTLTDNYVGAVFEDSEGTFDGGTITNSDPDSWDGLYVRNYAGVKAPDGDQKYERRASPSPDNVVSQQGGRANQSFTLSNTTITGFDRQYSWGVFVYGEEDVTTVNITGCTITHWGETGIYASENGGTVTVTANMNEISNNGDWGFYANTAAAQDATDNFWGDATGPYHNPNNTCGLGNAVSDNVDFYQWWTDVLMTTRYVYPTPVITCVADVTLSQEDERGAYATGYPTATSCYEPLTITYTDDRSGLDQCNATGLIIRKFMVTDNFGHADSCYQNITVQDATLPLISCPADIIQNTDAGECFATVTFTSSATDFGFFQGFESSGWEPVQGSGWYEYGSVVTQAASGTNGIISKTGAYHANINSTASSTYGIFSRLGGYNDIPNSFGNGFVTSQDIYFDLSDPAIPANTYGWDLSSAISRQDVPPPGDSHRRDFIFHTTAESAPGSPILLCATTGTNFTRFSPGFVQTLNHASITTSGWYTLQWVFRDDGNGILAVDCNLLDAGGTILWTETISEPSDDIATIIGGNRYMWFTFLEVENLAIDNTSLIRNPIVTSTPVSGATFSVGTTNVASVTYDACNNGPVTCNFDVTVEDNELPVAICQTAIVELDATGNATLNPADVDGGSTDPCGILSMSVVPNTFTCADLGTGIPVTLTVTDNNNNESTCGTSISVVDLLNPTVNCPGNQEVCADETLNDTYTASATEFDYTDAQDNCTVISVNYTLTGATTGNGTGSLDGVAFNAGTTTVTWTATDQSSNIGECSFEVTVNPLPDPVITGDFEVCAGATGEIYSTPLVAGNSYLWNVANGTIASGQGTNSITVDWTDISPGTVTVTEYAAGSFCAETASEDVTLIALPTPVVTGPATVVINSTENYSTTNNPSHAYTWSVTGGTISGGQNTSSITVLWPGTPGTGTVTVTELNLLSGCVANSEVLDVTITPGGVNISGYITYHNWANDPLGGLSLDLMQGTTVISSTTTDATGYYEFNNVLDGTYVIDVYSTAPSGGVNSTDAGGVNLWWTSPTSIEHVRWNAGDVAFGTGGSINSTDAGRIQSNYVLGTPFDRGEWTFWKQPDASSNNPPTSTNNIVVSGVNVVQDFFGLCVGDFNASNANPGTKAPFASDMELTYDGSIMAGADMEFELPIKVTASMQVAALSLILDFPSNLVTVEDVLVINNNIPSEAGSLDFNVIDNELRIGWNNIQAFDYTDGNIILSLKLRTTTNFTSGNIIEIALHPSPLNELADGQFNVISNVVLRTYTVEYSLTGIGEFELSKGTTIESFPNPFNEFTFINYNIPVDSKVKLEIYNMYGSLVKTLVNGPKDRGEHTVKFHALGKTAGVYTANIRVEANGHVVSRSIRIVINSY